MSRTTMIRQNNCLPYPKIIQIELTNRCPFHCPQCYRLELSELRLYEHRCNIIRTLELLDFLSNNCISTTTNIISTYQELSDKIQKCYMIAKRWYISSNVKLLSSIIEILQLNRVEEEKILRQAFDTVHQHLNSIYTGRGQRHEKN